MMLSILIPSLESRKHQLASLLTQLQAQIQPFKDLVEVITYIDQKEHTTGFKRQSLLEQAKGKYVVFCDDDDEVYPHYVSAILQGCNSNCDCMSIEGLMTTDKRKPIKWRISKNYEDKTIKVNNKDFYLRFSNHISPILREHALKAGFPDKSNAEDAEYSRRLRELGCLKNEYVIKGAIYHYKFSKFNKEYV